MGLAHHRLRRVHLALQRVRSRLECHILRRPVLEERVLIQRVIYGRATVPLPCPKLLRWANRLPRAVALACADARHRQLAFAFSCPP